MRLLDLLLHDDLLEALLSFLSPRDLLRTASCCHQVRVEISHWSKSVEVLKSLKGWLPCRERIYYRRWGQQYNDPTHPPITLSFYDCLTSTLSPGSPPPGLRVCLADSEQTEGEEGGGQGGVPDERLRRVPRQTDQAGPGATQ